MKLLQSNQLPKRPTMPGRVYRQSPWAMFLFAGVLICGTLGLIVGLLLGVIPGLFWLSVVVLAPISPFVLAIATSTLRKSNWIVQIHGSYLLLKYRSYRNHHFPDDGPTVVQIDFDDIVFVRKRTRKITVDSGDSTVTWRNVALELRLAHTQQDSDTLGEALRAEQKREGPLRGRGITVRSKSSHFPVTLPEPDLLRIAWRSREDRVTPSVDRALETLSRWLKIGEEVRVGGEATGTTSDEAIDEVILELAQSGDRLNGVKLLVKHHDMTLTEARQFIDELTDSGQPQAASG